MQHFWQLFAVVALFGGVPLAIWGYRFFHISLGPIGFAVGFTAGSQVAGYLEIGGGPSFLLGLFAGAVGALMSVATAALVIYLMGACVGAILIGGPAYLLLMLLQLDHHLGVKIILGVMAFAGGLAGGMYAWHFKKFVIILWSSIAGSFLVWFGLTSFLVGRAGMEPGFGAAFTMGTTPSIATVVINLICLILLADATWFQLKDARRLPELSLSNPLEGRKSSRRGRGSMRSRRHSLRR